MEVVDGLNPDVLFPSPVSSGTSPSSSSYTKATSITDSYHAPTSSTNEDIPEPDNTHRWCLICADKSDGAHFGVDSCRACAAFFRRSVVLKKKYVCRQGRSECSINKSIRIMCRKCRYIKCLQSGMLPENVTTRPQSVSAVSSAPPAPSLPPPVHHYQPPPPSLPPLTSLHAPSSTSSSSSFSSSLPPLHTPIFPTPVQVTPRPDVYPLLARISTNYAQMTSLRQSSELTLTPTLSLNAFFGGAADELRPCNFDLLNRIMKASVPIVADFCNSAFPEFASLAQDDKWALFRNFLAVLFHFECGLRSIKLMREQPLRRQITVTTYLDISCYERFFTDCEPPVEVQPNVIQILRERSESALAMKLQATFERLQLSDMEVAAFLGLTLWSPSSSIKSREASRSAELVHEVCLQSREAIFRDLHNYYRYALHLDEYAVRLGEFMSLFSNMQACTQKMREEMELFSLFDVFEKDSFVYHLLKQ